jgi:hypothetical protein
MTQNPQAEGQHPEQSYRPLTVAELAEAAIDMFIEYRDCHGYDEDQAKGKAIQEVVEGEQAREELKEESSRT